MFIPLTIFLISVNGNSIFSVSQAKILSITFTFLFFSQATFNLLANSLYSSFLNYLESDHLSPPSPCPSLSKPPSFLTWAALKGPPAWLPCFHHWYPIACSPLSNQAADLFKMFNLAQLDVVQWLSIAPRTKRSPVRFPVRHFPWLRARSLMTVSHHWGSYLSFPLSSSLKAIKQMIFFKKDKMFRSCHSSIQNSTMAPPSHEEYKTEASLWPVSPHTVWLMFLLEHHILLEAQCMHSVWGGSSLSPACTC